LYICRSFAGSKKPLIAIGKTAELFPDIPFLVVGIVSTLNRQLTRYLIYTSGNNFLRSLNVQKHQKSKSRTHYGLSALPTTLDHPIPSNPDSASLLPSLAITTLIRNFQAPGSLWSCSDRNVALFPLPRTCLHV